MQMKKRLRKEVGSFLNGSGGTLPALAVGSRRCSSNYTDKNSYSYTYRLIPIGLDRIERFSAYRLASRRNN